MMNKVSLVLMIMSFFFNSFAQTTNLGDPLAWNGKLAVKNIPEEKMTGFDQAIINAEDEINDTRKDRPWRFGYKYDVNYSLQNAGNWTVLPNGDRVWQLIIECENAITINLLLGDYFLPDGAYLYLYDIDKTNRVGAYTKRNNRSDGELGTELVHGEKIIVEYVEPSKVIGQGKFTITNVIHGYRSLDPIQKQLEKGLNDAGDCNIDVNCPLGNGWENEIRSVALIVVGGSGVCTGALINNTCDNGTPYFLTANHCLGGGTGSWAFRFNWESPPGTESCATTANSVNPGPPYDQTANGATTLVSGTAADHALLEIDNMTLTDAQNWNCFYAGWDATDATTVTQATGIHHPSGDLKKICRENNAPYHANAGGAAVWYIDEWEEGVTEPGSSGSPLFDQNHRIIGQLYGGLAACSGTNNNGEYDYYGRLGVSWNNGIDAYLAPNSCGNATINDGWDPNAPTLPDDAGVAGISSPSGPYCVDNFDPEVSLRNYGTNNLTSVIINYDIDGGPNNTYSWNGNLAPGASQAIVLPNMTTTSGAHTFNAYTTLPNGNTDSNPVNDVASSNFTATIGGQDILLEINTDCYGSEITWTIEDAGSNVLASGGPYADNPNGDYIAVNLCLSVDCYDFIINDSYGDGLNGSSFWACSIDGDYTITDVASGTVLASILAPNSDFGTQEINNFCVTSPCSWSLNSSTNEESCFGDNTGSVTVTVAGGTGTFTYDIGNGPQSSNTFNNLSQGSYNVIVDDGSCSSSISVVLSGPTAISASSNVADETFGMDGEIDLTVSGGIAPYSYSWTGPSGFTANSEDITGLTGGLYSVTITDANGCIYTESDILVNSSVDIKDETSLFFKVFPNPSNGLFNIYFNGTKVDLATVQLFDLTGRQLQLEKINNKDVIVIDLSNKANGIYLLKVSIENKQFQKRIIKL